MDIKRICILLFTATLIGGIFTGKMAQHTDAQGGYDMGAYEFGGKPGGVYVDDDYTISTPGWNYTHFNKIQNGINGVAENGTVYVHNGKYNENVIITKAIKLRGDPEIDARGEIGIKIESSNVFIENFTIYNGSVGIYVHNVSYALHNITIRNCKIYSCIYNGMGIEFENVNASRVEECEIYNNTIWGIVLINSSNNVIHHNLVYNHTSVWNSAGIVMFLSSIHNNISSNVVHDNGIDNIEIWNNSFYNIIWNNTLYAADYGILLSRNANENVITKNTISENMRGIGIGHTNSTWGGAANNNSIMNNFISNNVDGIFIMHSNNSQIISNFILNGTSHGIYMEYSTNNSIYGNTIGKNKYGIHLFFSSVYNLLANNTIYDHNDEGIYLFSSSNHNFIRNNTVYDNTYGIRIYASYNNIIYNNNFSNTINAWDNGYNTWNISKAPGTNIINGPYLGGNYWNDYDGVDINGDGLGDTDLPYGPGDWLPLIEPNYAPIANFSWQPLYPTTPDIINFTDSSIDLDGIIVNHTWDFGDGNKSYEENPRHRFGNEGIYNVTLIVRDDDGAMANITKKVLVSSQPSVDYILITFYTRNEISAANISTNVSINVYASAFNNTYGFVSFINANWNIINYASSATINSSHGKNVLLNTGMQNGTAVLHASYNGYNDSITFRINSSLFSFILHDGWNFITLPCEHNYTASLLFTAIEGCNIVLAWNASMQDFIAYMPGSPYDFIIEDGHGYFLAMDEYEIFSIAYIPLNNVSVNLYTGWNALGWFKEPTTSKSIYENITNCTMVLTWDPILQNFLVYVPNSPYNPAICPGDGFFVAVSNESIWHGEG